MDQPRGTTMNPAPDVFMSAEQGAGEGGDEALGLGWYAPWRSLIYRNVDNPFAYTDDSALFPHMPMNTPGYDDRARQVLSDWMVSIPAVRKTPEVPEYAFVASNQAAPAFGNAVDWSQQPYVEVLAGDPRYAAATAAATQRLQILHSGLNPGVPLAANGAAISRYAFPGLTEDIIDPSVSTHLCNPVPLPVFPKTSSAGGLAAEDIPAHCDWVVTDTTQPPGAWSPRRPDWATVLVDLQTPQPPACPTGAEGEAATAVTELQDITLPPLASGAASAADGGSSGDYLTTPTPFGLWQQPEGASCDYSAQTTVQSVLNSPEPPLWMKALPSGAAGEHVYMSTPGQAVFNMICVNCHGPLADATGRLAQNLATMTGGLDLVADFRDGLFGPTSSPESNLDAVFSVLPSTAPASWTSVTNDDRAARYMSWMALGGTQVTIPQGLLTIVSATPVLGLRRPLPPPITSANMLSTAKALCDSVLGPTANDGFKFSRTDVTAYSTSLIPTIGDNELWIRLCSLNNPAPIHVINGRDASDGLTISQAFNSNGSFVPGPSAYLVPNPDPSTFPPGTPIGDHRGEVVPFTPNDPTNFWPWCVNDDAQNTFREMGYPVCPPAALTLANEFGNADPNQAEEWSVRGAINAGLAVFRYVQSLEKLTSAPADYDQCELLP